MRTLILVSVLAACGGSSPAPAPAKAPPPPPAASDDLRARCAAALAKAGETGRGDEVFSAEDQKFSVEIEAVMTDSCAATSWPPFMLMCLTHGTSREEIKSCTDLLTPVQRQDMMERVLVVTKKHEK